MLKALMLKKDLDTRKAELEKLETHITELQTREAELEQAIAEANTEEERAVVTENVEAFEADKTDSANKAEELRNTIASLEAELAELEEKEPSNEPIRSNETLVNVRKDKTMENIELRNKPEYIRAYADYIKTGEDKQVRALLTTNATDAVAEITGYLPVPELVYDVVKTAWDEAEIMNLVNKTNLKGNVKVGFELTAGGAVVHKEGASAPDEEVITLGIVEMIPQSFKKWITISDEAFDLEGADFLNYVYRELTYKIAKAVEDALIDMIMDAPTSADSDEVAVAQVATAPALGAVASGIAQLCSEARNLAIVTTRANWALMKTAQYEANYAQDIFEGLPVYFNDTLEDYATGDAGDVWMILGDFKSGAQANFPNGQAITIKVDNLSLAEKDLVKFVGREYVGLGLVASKRFVNFTVPSGE